MEPPGTAGESEASSPHVVLISAGASHSVALLSGHIVCSWGRGEDGQLGHGNAEDRLIPTLLSALDNARIVSIVCGADHTTAYSESELQVYSWGWGDFGRLGHGNSSDVFTPQPIKALQGIKIKQIACGDSHCLAVTMDGEVQSWGRNQNGQLGLGTTEDSLVPQKIQSFQGIPVKMIAAGAEHTAAVTEDGELYGWGWGQYGNLGLGDRNDRLIPEKVSSVGERKMVLVACGWRHTITVSSSGGLYTYGWSKYGQLGHGDFEDHLVPHQVEALQSSHVSQISGGWRHTMGLTSDGKLYGWGWNKFGQVGVGDNVDHCSPVQVKFPNEEKVVQISCGWRHTIAVTERKNLFSWGRGTCGQLGHGDILDRDTPKMIEVLSTDGSGCKEIDSLKIESVSGKVWISPSERYAIVPDEKLTKELVDPVKGNGNDASVPDTDVKRIRI
ncbi:Regulator of chromosome condensation 1/beta-lactamase-inhibitor protein II [Dioscorea alata]|uniref:Regulator of chromosome condensation 1/beta-lactamase-inhibitor protein II n=3 Tax=Dioscorea alata TaxID=55571 RepID=A0ACB7VC07_DIOAL|nr:Regulator of chromosome condensation 1/beta-lactamase-inhibitor protein II [Dioscorea alata]KAH7671087.1 Regulator of chromosome condensation 1/beta-lactamase-inhibitor protein II [Dioscorea alata]KAH7671088.1 Regulator of chromosome condensation 1/beta-lactamase-inhibitor protein II [Dioscorea alata]